MKKSDVDMIIQGLAPAIHAFVSQKIGPITVRIHSNESGIESAKAIAQEVAARVDHINQRPEPEPEPDFAAAFAAALRKCSEFQD